MGGTVIVVGASMAGLVAARALADHADDVVVLERDELGDEVAARRGVPQGRHAHAILASGERQLERWFPGIVAEWVAAGAVRADGGDARWWQNGGYRIKADTGDQATCLSRPLLETVVRRRLEELANVHVRRGAHVEGPVVEGGRVTGVRVDGDVLRSDLVIDCSGRNTGILAALAASGCEVPAVANVRIDMSYTTRVVRRRSDDIDAAYCIIAPTPPGEPRFGVMLPMEGDRWIVTMGGFHGDRCPTDDDGFSTFARSLPSPLIAQVLERAEVLVDSTSYRMGSSQRRLVEKMSSPPAGYVLLGDAVCSFNPIYGQGMSSASLQAAALADVVARRGLHDERLPRAFYRKAAKVVANPWQIAAGGDFLHPATTGPKPPGTDVINRYVLRVMAAAQTSPKVMAHLSRVGNLLAPPPSLMAPPTLARVLWATRRGQRSAVSTATATAPSQPRVV